MLAEVVLLCAHFRASDGWSFFLKDPPATLDRGEATRLAVLKLDMPFEMVVTFVTFVAAFVRAIPSLPS